MDDKKDIIGLKELIDEVTVDLDELVKKHSGDYAMKNIRMWWELESERVLARHSPQTIVKKMARRRRQWMMFWFFAGWATLLVMNTVVRLLLG